MAAYNPDTIFNLDAQVIRARLTRRISLLEFAALALNLTFIPIFLWLHTQNPAVLSDYNIYLATGYGEFTGFYYAIWLLPFFKILGLLPFWFSYSLYALLSITGLFLFSRVIRGEAAAVLFTYQSFYVLHYGQVTSLLTGGLALMWWALSERKWGWAGFGLLLASVKYQSGLPVAGLLLLFAPIQWRNRLNVCLVPLAAVIISLLLYPTWVSELIQRLQSSPANDFGSISLWRYIWIGAVLLLLPPFLTRIPKNWKNLAWIASIPLITPYFQQADLLFILPFFPVWAIIASNLGFLYLWLLWDGLRLLALVPLSVYCFALVSGFRFKTPLDTPSAAEFS